jgi:hypothetical protein
VFYTDTLARVDTYTALSHRYAQTRDAVSAVASLWAADISTVQMISWERIMIASPDPDRQFFDVAMTVSRALGVYATTVKDGFATAEEVVLASRRGLESAFDESFLTVLHARYAPTTHLAGLPAPTANMCQQAALARLQGMNVREYIQHRKDVAHHAMGEARTLNEAGNIDAAIAQAYQADLAAFEAYLVESAVAVGDQDLMTVGLRWDIAAESIAQMPGLPRDLEGATEAIRTVLAKSVGPVEAERIQQALEPVT